MKPWMAPSTLDPFEDDIESVQPRLRALIFSMTGRREDVGDIVQETNHVIWRKRDEFEQGTNFWAWVSKIAFFQVMAYRKKRARDRHVFGDELVHLIADESSMRLAAAVRNESERLEVCVGRLPERQREAIQARYFRDESVPEISESMGLNENAVSQLLFRARQGLRNCLKHSPTTES